MGVNKKKVENALNQTISNVFNIVSRQHALNLLFNLFTILTSLVMTEKADSFV